MRIVIFDHVELSADTATILSKPFSVRGWPVVIATLTAHTLSGAVPSLVADFTTSDDGVLYVPFGATPVISPLPDMARVVFSALSERLGGLMRARALLAGGDPLSSCFSLAVDLLESP